MDDLNGLNEKNEHYIYFSLFLEPFYFWLLYARNTKSRSTCSLRSQAGINPRFFLLRNTISLAKRDGGRLSLYPDAHLGSSL